MAHDQPTQTFDGDYRVIGQRVREPFINLAALRALLWRICVTLCWGAFAYGVSKAVHWALHGLFH